MTDLPEPFVPAEVDLRDFPFVPIDAQRLFNSQFHARANDAEWRAGVTLWLKSFHQVPAASLPDDDVALARLAELGRDVKGWRKIKAMALYGWVKCSDGLLYHPVVAEKALNAWERKKAQRDRTEKARTARLQQRTSQTDNPSVTEHVTGSKREGEGQREGESSISSLRSEARSQARGSRLPDDWQPDHGLKAWALNELPDTLDLDAETERFRDYWRSVSGAKGCKADWPATWRNWMRRAAERLQPRPQQQHRSGFAAMATEAQRARPAATVEGDLLTINAKATHVD